MDNFNYQVVQPQSSVTDKSIATANTHIFNYNAASNESVNLNKSFFNVELSVEAALVNLTTTFGDTLTSEGLAQGMQFAAFASSEFYTNNVLCDRINNFIAHNVAKLYLNASSDFTASISPFYLPERAGFDAAYVANTLRANNAKRLLNCAMRVKGADPNASNGAEIDFSTSSGSFPKTFDLCFSIPFPHLTNATSDMLGNCLYSCKLQSNGAAVRDMFSGLLPGNADTVVKFKNLTWIIPTFRTTIPSSLTASYLYNEVYTYSTTMNTGSYQVSPPSNTNLVLIYLSYTTDTRLYNAAGGGGTTDTTIPASCTLRGDPRMKAAAPYERFLDTLYVNFAGNNYPNEMYNFANNRDLVRAHQTYIRNCGAFSLGEEPLAKCFESFVRYPVFAFKVSSSTNTNVGGTQNMMIYTTTTPIANVGVQLNVACFSEKTLEVEYGEYGQIVSTNVMINA